MHLNHFIGLVKYAIDQNCDYLSVNMDIEEIKQLLTFQQLLQIDEATTAESLSKYHKNCVILQNIRLMSSERLVSFCESLKSSREAIGEKMISGKFMDMINQLAEMLNMFDPVTIAEICGSLKASENHDISLFTENFVKELKECKKIKTLLLQKLAPFMNWIDHSILNALVEACNVPQAIDLLINFHKEFDTSLRITKYPIPSPSHCMVPFGGSTHTVLAAQLTLQWHQCTLQNVVEARSLLQEKCEVTHHCLQLLAAAGGTSHTIIYWLIPKHVANHIASNAHQCQNHLYQNGIQVVALYPGIIIVTGSTLTVGPFAYFAMVSSFPTQYSSMINSYRYPMMQMTVLVHKFVNWR